MGRTKSGGGSTQTIARVRVAPNPPKPDGNKKAEKKKKKCELGLSCKYIHEYQHALEYCHEELMKPKPFQGKGHKLGGDSPTTGRHPLLRISSSTTAVVHPVASTSTGLEYIRTNSHSEDEIMSEVLLRSLEEVKRHRALKKEEESQLNAALELSMRY
jgi:hypothetical protein